MDYQASWSDPWFSKAPNKEQKIKHIKPLQFKRRIEGEKCIKQKLLYYKIFLNTKAYKPL